MQIYANHSGRSAVIGYDIRETSIIVYFNDGHVYQYDHTRPGKSEVEEMQKLALAGVGLNTYINQHVRDNYARKLS